MRLLSVEILGMKSINKPIKIDFFNKIVDFTIEKQSAVKGIYGPNGAGKSAIVNALNIYKDISYFKGSLAQPIILDSLKNLINKKIKTFSISVCFYDYDKKTKSDYRMKHTLSINMNSDDPTIELEKIEKLDERLNSKIIFEQHNGNATTIDGDIDNELRNLTTNLLDKNSFTSLLVDKLMKLPSKSKKTDLFSKYGQFLNIVHFVFSMSICFGSKNDVMSYNFFNKSNKKFSPIFRSLISSVFEDSSFYNDNFNYYVVPENIDKFKQYISKMVAFIKVIKPELDDIQVAEIPGNEVITCRLNFVYNQIPVDLQYESTGIKKLVDIYETLTEVSRGNIGIIDEFDAGLHDVIMDRLIKYFAEETNGQLIFTTHNISILGYLKEYDHSIDFLSTDSVLTKWVKNGTSSPESVYVKGGIPHIPFNIESLDFKGKF